MKLSIITINLNNSKGLEKTIESVICQTFSDYEWIIIDGGSTDNSIDILRQNSSLFSFSVSEKDNGIYHAQNKGILKASGDYCFFLNSGDYFVDSKVLEKIFNSDFQEDILFGNLYVTINGQVIGEAYGKAHLTFSDIYSHKVKHQATFIKRSLFKRFGLFNENRKIIADWEFFIKSVGLGNASYRYVNLFICYFDNSGLSNQNSDIAQQERLQVIKEYIPLMMYPDYEFLNKYKRYENLYSNRLSFFLVRLINKCCSNKIKRI